MFSIIWIVDHSSKMYLAGPHPRHDDDDDDDGDGKDDHFDDDYDDESDNDIFTC